MHEIAPFMQRGFSSINNYVRIHSRNEGEIFMIKDIKNKSEFENLVEKNKNLFRLVQKKEF